MIKVFKRDGLSELMHSAKGTKWSDHKYVAIKNGRYIYPEEAKRGLTKLREDQIRKNHLVRNTRIAGNKWAYAYDKNRNSGIQNNYGERKYNNTMDANVTRQYPSTEGWRKERNKQTEPDRNLGNDRGTPTPKVDQESRTEARMNQFEKNYKKQQMEQEVQQAKQETERKMDEARQKYEEFNNKIEQKELEWEKLKEEQDALTKKYQPMIEEAEQLMEEVDPINQMSDTIKKYKEEKERFDANRKKMESIIKGAAHGFLHPVSSVTNYIKKR